MSLLTASCRSVLTAESRSVLTAGSRSVLLVLCSPHPGSASREAAERLAGHLAGGAAVVRRDLAADPPPLVNADFVEAMRRRAGADDPAFAASEVLIAELEAASSVVIGLPMHNYTVPAALKAWVDQVVRIGRSFDPTPAGKVGRLADRPGFVVVATGGVISGDGPTRQPDFVTPYVTAVLRTIGIRNVRFLYLEALRDAAARESAMAAARKWISAQIPLVPEAVS
jgi:FMN-dependent NADH-azoreductase